MGDKARYVGSDNVSYFCTPRSGQPSSFVSLKRRDEGELSGCLGREFSGGGPFVESAARTGRGAAKRMDQLTLRSSSYPSSMRSSQPS